MENPAIIATNYLKVIKAFKNRYDVQNGFALAYRPGQDPRNTPNFENIPKTIGQGLTTTGWCVSVSQALLLDNVFQLLVKTREAYAKLISIDIKEQYYGSTYSGNQNKWHTAILVKDSGNHFVLDMTCAQFGNQFVEKFIWDLETWEKTFRSPMDKHKLTDFDGGEIAYLPIQNNKNNSEVSKAEIISKMHDITTITDGERIFLADFFTKNINDINKKLYIGNINKFDYDYISTLNKLLKELDFVKDSENKYYRVLEFNTKEGASTWIKSFLKNDCILNEYALFSDNLKKSCDFSDVKLDNINNVLSRKTYIVLTIENMKGISIDFLKNVDVLLPVGIKLELNIATDIFNGGKVLISGTDEGLEKKTNTIYINASI